MRLRRLLLTAILLVAGGAVWVGLRSTAYGPVQRPAPAAAAVGASAAGQTAAASPAGEPIPDGSTEAPRGPALAGMVVDALSGAGIAGAELTFSLGGTAASVRTEPGGTFWFFPPAEGGWRLAAATAPGYLPFAPEWGHSPITFDAERGRVVRGVTIRLSAAIPLEGRVLGPDGQPITGAEVRLLGALREAALVPIADRFTSGADGRFTFAAPEGTVVEARADGFLPGREEVDFLARARGAVTIRLQEAAHVLPAAAPIDGRVVGRDGAPIAGALVSASRELGFGVADATAAAVLTAADGAFTLADLGPGWWRLTARAEGKVPAAARRVEPGARGVLLTLADGGRLRGCAADAATGEPIVTLSIHLFDARSALGLIPRESRASIDPSGCWALGGLAPGRVRVVVSAPGYAPSAPRDVEVPEPGRGEAVVDARLDAGGRLTGVVVSEETGAPIEGARVALEGQLESATSALPALAEAGTDARGRFALVGLPRRASILVAAAGHHARIVGGLETAPGAAIGPITVSLRPAGPEEEPRVDLAGIGVALAPHGDGFTITGVVADGGASRAGLARGDVILGVDGRSVLDLGMADAIEAIRGPEGTNVTLTVRRAGRTESVTVTRTVVRG